LIARRARGYLGERLPDGERVANLVFPLVEFLAGVLPVVERDTGVDRRKQIYELLVLSEALGVKLVVEAVQQVVALHSRMGVGTLLRVGPAGRGSSAPARHGRREGFRNSAGTAGAGRRERGGGWKGTPPGGGSGRT
jgi:hypothetical protein